MTVYDGDIFDDELYEDEEEDMCFDEYDEYYDYHYTDDDEVNI